VTTAKERAERRPSARPTARRARPRPRRTARGATRPGPRSAAPRIAPSAPTRPARTPGMARGPAERGRARRRRGDAAVRFPRGRRGRGRTVRTPEDRPRALVTGSRCRRRRVPPNAAVPVGGGAEGGTGGGAVGPRRVVVLDLPAGQRGRLGGLAGLVPPPGAGGVVPLLRRRGRPVRHGGGHPPHVGGRAHACRLTGRRRAPAYGLVSCPR
jgi:hypothetical protein